MDKNQMNNTPKPEGKNNGIKLIHMNEVETAAIDCHWYSYIPFGKVTVIFIYLSIECIPYDCQR